jgi:hypothetical protein
MGFQHDNDPASDIRGGGLLSVECLVYLFETHTAVARRIFAKSPAREAARGDYATYPFACAAITLVKRLCEVLLISEPVTGRATRAYEDTPTTFWHVAGTRAAFLELFVWTLVTFDELWDECRATYMDFGRVCSLAMQRVVNTLYRLPADVVPFARSLACAADINTCDDIDVVAMVSRVFDGPLGEEYSGAIAMETTSAIDATSPRTAHDRPLFADATEDLLGLADLHATNQQIFISPYIKEDPHNQGHAAYKSVNFFAEFGLVD